LIHKIDFEIANAIVTAGVTATEEEVLGVVIDPGAVRTISTK